MAVRPILIPKKERGPNPAPVAVLLASRVPLPLPPRLTTREGHLHIRGCPAEHSGVPSTMTVPVLRVTGQRKEIGDAKFGVHSEPGKGSSFSNKR